MNAEFSDLAKYFDDIETRVSPQAKNLKPNVAIAFFGIGRNDFDTNRKLSTIAFAQRIKKLGWFRCN